MDIIDSITDYFINQNGNKDLTSPVGTCPICWGNQEYDGKIRTLLKDKQIDVNNRNDSYMIIQEFVKTNIDGIKMKEEEVKNCPKCGFENNEV